MCVCGLLISNVYYSSQVLLQDLGGGTGFRLDWDRVWDVIYVDMSFANLGMDIWTMVWDMLVGINLPTHTFPHPSPALFTKPTYTQTRHRLPTTTFLPCAFATPPTHTSPTPSPHPPHTFCLLRARAPRLFPTPHAHFYLALPFLHTFVPPLPHTYKTVGLLRSVPHTPPTPTATATLPSPPSPSTSAFRHSPLLPTVDIMWG